MCGPVNFQGSIPRSNVEMLCSDVVNLNEDQLKQLRAVCESEDEEENDVDVKRLY